MELKPYMSPVHYDLTASNFQETEDKVLVLLSNSATRGKEQIVMGMVMLTGKPGIPKPLNPTILVPKNGLQRHVKSIIFGD